MDSMKARLLTAAIGIPAAVVVLILGESLHWIMYLIVALLSAIMVFELLSAKKLHRNPMIVIPCVLYSLIQPFLLLVDAGLFPLYIFTVLMFFIMILNNARIMYSDVAFSIVGVLLISWGMSSILLMPPAYFNYYSFFFVVCLGVPWSADAGAYFTGVFFGTHKLCPKVSPNKTVEGFLGGIAIGTLSALVIGFVYSFIYPKAEFNYGVMLIIGALASVMSVLGDLTFSLIKRQCKIKDYGSFFPGHGGFLDRFDSVIFSAPLIYFISRFISIFIV